MKTNLRFLLLMLLTAVGCNDSTQNEQATGSTTGQPQPVPADSTVIELPSITNTLGMKLNEIPAGNFLMGSPESEAYREDDETQHKVTISKAFYMQTTEVTQGQWKAVMGTEPWKGQEYSKYIKEGANYAATHVSWDDAIAYCKKLSEKEGKSTAYPPKRNGSTPAGQEPRHGGALAMMKRYLAITLGMLKTRVILMISMLTKLD